MLMLSLGVGVPTGDLAESGLLAADLADDLRDYDGVELRRTRDNPGNQDLGATLILVLGTGAVTALAKGLAAWLQRHHEAKITIKSKTREGGEFEVELLGRTSRDARELAAKIVRELSAVSDNDNDTDTDTGAQG